MKICMLYGGTSFEREVFKGRVGDFVGPVETEFGFHIVYIEDSRPSSFSFLSRDEFLDAVLLRSSTRDVGELKVLSGLAVINFLL